MRAINLIPAEQRRGAGGIAGRTGGIVYVVLATLVALVVVGLIYALAVHDVAKRQTTLAQVTNETATVQQQVAALEPYVAFETFAQQRIASIASVAAQRFDWPRAMAQIALALPSNVTLDGLGGTAGSGAPSGATSASGLTVNAPSLSVSGCAVGSASVGQDTVAETLARFRALQDVSSATVSTYAAGDCHGVAFSMTISYGDAFAIPSARLTASPRTTVGG